MKDRILVQYFFMNALIPGPDSIDCWFSSSSMSSHSFGLLHFVAFLIYDNIINRTFGSISISNSFKIEATCDNRLDN